MMYELILVLFLLINDVDGWPRAYGPLISTIDGQVVTFSSHQECIDFGDELMVKDSKIDGFMCAVKPMPRSTI